MKPRWFLALAYLLVSLGWLHLGLLALDPNEELWTAIPYFIQSAGAALAIAAALLLPRIGALNLHWMGLAVIAFASTAQTVHGLNDPGWSSIAGALQSLGLLVAFTYAVKWWLNSSGIRFARRFALGHLVAAIGALTMLGLEFTGHGHPLQNVQRPYAAVDDALIAIGLVLAAWMGGVAALTLKTPEPVIKP